MDNMETNGKLYPRLYAMSATKPVLLKFTRLKEVFVCVLILGNLASESDELGVGEVGLIAGDVPVSGLEEQLVHVIVELNLERDASAVFLQEVPQDQLQKQETSFETGLDKRDKINVWLRKGSRCQVKGRVFHNDDTGDTCRTAQHRPGFSLARPKNPHTKMKYSSKMSWIDLQHTHQRTFGSRPEISAPNSLDFYDQSVVLQSGILFSWRL